MSPQPTFLFTWKANECHHGSTSHCFRALLSAASVFLSCTADGAIIYRETFGRPDPATGNVGTVEFDWARWQTSGAAGATNSGVSSDGVGKPTDLSNVNAGNNIDGTTNAYAEGWSYQDGTLRLSATNEYTVDVASYAPGSIVFSWYQGAAKSLPPTRW